MTPKAERSQKIEAARVPLDSTKTIEVGAGVFKNTCLALMDKVRDEHLQVLISKHGRPVARLVPANVAVPTALGHMRGTIIEQHDIVSPDFDAWGGA